MSSESSTRDYPRVVLVVLCVVATVLAAVLVPALTASGVVGSPAQSVFPGETFSSGSDEGDGGPGQRPDGGSGGGFGALNPGSNTDVGGAISEGAFQSQETDVHLTVRSTQPAYWRTGTYDTYTGSGWERSNPVPEPYSEPIASGGMRGEQVSYRVTLNRSATALPTVWRPASIVGLQGLRVTDGGALRADGAFRPGTFYSGLSYKPPRDPQVLRTSGQSYPAPIERQYAALPDPSPRLTALTDDITADADTPYAKAQAIEAWLEANKTYSLDVSRTSENIAETFVFEMERGYCEYFATSMVVMLRTQDIPARYVVGYSTGQQVEENTYQVRAMNAHAWVEVYFEDVGWVKFDPTPGSARLQQEQQSLNETNPGETFTPGNESTNQSAGTTNGTVSNETASGYTVTLNRSAVPGATVEVTVTLAGQPVVRTVSFNGRRVGTTGADGTVVGTVPYVDTLRISVEEPSGALRSPPGRVPPASERFYNLPPPAASGTGIVPDAENVTIPVETNATVTVSGDTLPGATVTVTATVQNVPVGGAAVLVGGERVATTGADGRATVRLPERPGEVTIAVRRDPVAGETTVTVPALNVTVSPATPLALPFAPASVSVTAGGKPVSGATVGIGGQAVATSGIDGTATVTLPFASRATVTAAAYGTAAETTVSGLLANLALLLGALVAFVGGPLVLAARRDYRPRHLLAFLRRLPLATVRYAQWALVTLATRGDELLVRAVRRLRLALAGLANLLRGRVDLRDLLSRARSWLRTRWAALRAPGESSAAGFRPQSGAEPLDPDRLTVREAWDRFLGHVSVRRPGTRTPGEIARHAVRQDGLPRRPVRVLRDAFREVEYGERSAAERSERAEQAVAAIERERTDDARPDGGSDRASGDGDPATDRRPRGER